MRKFKHFLALTIYLTTFVLGIAVLTINFDLQPVTTTFIYVLLGALCISIGSSGIINRFNEEENKKRQQIIDLINGSDTILNLTDKEKVHYIVLSDYIIGLYHDQQLDSFDREYLIRQKVEELIDID